MSSMLEQRYRAALRWYPARWRASNADAVVGTLLDVADAEHRRSPARFELLHLAASGIRTRFAPIARVLPENVRDKASGVALGFGFGLAGVMLVLQEWAPWATDLTRFDLKAESAVGPFSGWGGVLYSIWVLAFLSFAAGGRRLGRGLLLATVPFSIALVLVDGGADTAFRPTTYGLAILGSLALITAMGRPFAGKFSWLPVGLVVLFASSAVVFPYLDNVALDERLSPRMMWGFVSLSQGLFAWTIYIIAAITVGALIARAASWAGAMVVVSLPIVIISLIMLADQRDPAIMVMTTLVVGLMLSAIVLWRASGLRLQVVRRD